MSTLTKAGWAGLSFLATAGASEEGLGNRNDFKLDDPAADSGWGGSVELLWEDRYLSEGRDELDGDDLFSAQLEISRGNWTASWWSAGSPGSSYRENQVALCHAWKLGRLEIEPGVALLWFPDGGRSDQELGVRISWEIGGGWEIGWHGYHSFDAGGSYHLTELVSPLHEVGPIRLGVRAGAGFNGGYVDDGHRGLDHAFGALEGEWALGEGWSVVGRILYASAVDRDRARAGDDALHTGFQLGLGLVTSF